MEHCERFETLISQAMDGPLSLQDRQALDAHLDQCPECRALETELRQIRAEFDTWEEQEAPDGFAEGVMDRIRALETPQKVVPLWKKPQVRALGSLAACAVLCVGLLRTGLFSTKLDEAAMPQTAAAESQQKYTYTPEVENDTVYTAVGIGSSSVLQDSAPVPEPTEPAEPELYKSELNTRQSPAPMAMSADPEDTSGGEALLQQVAGLLGAAPGTLLLVEELPGDLPGTALTQDGLAVLTLDEIPDGDALQALKEGALLCVENGEGAVVLAAYTT